MNDDREPYVPISCEFHDVLEGLAATKRISEVVWLDRDSIRQTRTGKVSDVYSDAGVEYLMMDSGEVVRLDKIIEADGISIKTFAL